MPKLDRRKFLKTSGAGAVAATTGGLADILAAGRAPAFAQGTTLHWLRLGDFVPASDTLLRKDLHDFALESGAVRDNYGINSNDYGRAFFSATDRVGVSDEFTRELRIEWLRDQQTIGASGAWLIDQFAVASASLIRSAPCNTRFAPPNGKSAASPRNSTRSASSRMRQWEVLRRPPVSATRSNPDAKGP